MLPIGLRVRREGAKLGNSSALFADIQGGLNYVYTRDFVAVRYDVLVMIVFSMSGEDVGPGRFPLFAQNHSRVYFRVDFWGLWTFRCETEVWFGRRRRWQRHFQKTKFLWKKSLLYLWHACNRWRKNNIRLCRLNDSFIDHANGVGGGGGNEYRVVFPSAVHWY